MSDSVPKRGPGRPPKARPSEPRRPTPFEQAVMNDPTLGAQVKAIVEAPDKLAATAEQAFLDDEPLADAIKRDPELLAEVQKGLAEPVPAGQVQVLTVQGHVIAAEDLQDEPAAPPRPPAKVPYRQLAEELCDWIIESTEGHPRESRYPVCLTAMKYAIRLLPQRFVKQTKRAA